MTVKELYAGLQAVLPPSLSADWDNDGLACCPDGAREVRRVLVTLDVTDAAVDKAINEGFDVILSHHPLLFRGIKALDGDTPLSAKLVRLVRAGVSAMSFHTRLDAAKGGVNDTVAALLGLLNLETFGTEELGEIGRIGKLAAPHTARTFAEYVAKKLNVSAVLLVGGDREIRTVALVGGEGGDFLDAAKAAGADLFLSGRVGYHRMLDAAESGISVIEAGHFATEAPVCERLAELVNEIDPDLGVEILELPAIETLVVRK